MAYRDKSQGFAFIYTNPKKLWQSLQASEGGHPTATMTPGPAAVLTTPTPSNETLERLKSNLSRLEEMQLKVRFMIQELEKLSSSKKKS